ncbi:MAG: putative Xenobiotic-transporting ATPase [Candidatus Saccharibacteria bacterium]|nr:putative Xenobiotic-transporting ATPase [Candidatus Saccharibacteria bacterium]
MSQIYDAIEKAIAGGVPPQYVTSTLIRQGWPANLVNEAMNAWLISHGRLHKKTDFKQWLTKYKRKAFGSTVVLVILSVLSSSILLLQPWPTKILVDSGFGSIQAPGPLAPYTHKPALILITSLLTIAVFLVGIIFGTLRDYFLLRLGFKLNSQIKEESFRHILHLPLYHQERLAKGDYIYRQNVLTNSLSDLVLNTTSSIIQSVIMIAGVLVIMLTFNVKLTLISVVLVPFLFLLIKVFGPRLGGISRLMAQNASLTSATITESVDNAETLQAFTLEEKQITKARNLWQQNYKFSRDGLLFGRLYRFSNSLLIILGTSAVMYLGGSAALRGEMTLGQLLIFMTYMGYLLGPVEAIATEIAMRNQKLVDVSRVYEVLTDHEGVENLRKENHFPAGRGSIEFQNVTYAYNDTVVIKGVNLKIEPGQKVAIIGPSGGGKSTLLKLLPLFIEPTLGRVMVDNIDIQTVSLTELRQNIVWISQTPQLFNETILENLQDGNVYKQISGEEIDNAITAANVKEFTGRLPIGLNSPAGEGGNSLSGGQKQRIAIARGLLKNAPIVCMDEPTAALDSKSEIAIRDSISKLIQGKTVLMVTHRKALLSLMDVIYVMDGGQLHPVEQFGGLDAYMEKISEGEESTRATEAVQAHEEQVQQLVGQLQQQNQQLQERLSASSAANQAKSNQNDGTVYISINH